MLRPVGEIVPLKTRRSEEFQPPANYRICWVDSGTTALAIAIRAVTKRSTNRVPRVAMPAYACPDLIAATLWAGAIPVVVDTRANTPWLDAAQIASQPRDYFSAAIAPHFLGIPHPLEALRSLCDERGITLIEDAAQTSVRSSAFRPTADLVVLSFGRGKPIPVGGGALLHTGRWSAEIDDIVAGLPWESGSIARWKLRTAAQNLAMTRVGYSLVRSLPWLAVGSTRFVPLLSPARTPDKIACIRGSVLEQWTVTVTQQQKAIASIVAGSPLVTDLAGSLGWDGHSELLRYPVLAENLEERNRLLSRLRTSHIEATSFYGTTVNRATDVPETDLIGDVQHAERFANRLLTLPAHSDVTMRDIADMAGCLQSR